MDRIRIGTRGSKLALKQAALVQEALVQTYNKLETEIVVVHTRGDKIQDKPLAEIGGKGVFASELERALQEGDIDLAVHSAKDLPITLAEGLLIAAVLKRGDVRDVLVVPKGGRLPRIKESGQRSFCTESGENAAGERGAGADGSFVIGSGSRRRQCLAARIWENAVCKDIRGNVDTRLQKLINAQTIENACEKGRYNGIILAKAGLDRLDIISRYDSRFDFYPLAPERFLPAACQGIIAVEARQGSEEALLCENITDAETQLCFLTEREVLAALSADCSEVIAAWCRQEGESLRLDVMYAGNRCQADCPANACTETEKGRKTALIRMAREMAREAAVQVEEMTKQTENCPDKSEMADDCEGESL